MKYLLNIICISIFIILVCLFIQNSGYKEGLNYTNYNKVLLQINIVESAAAKAITSIKADSNFAEYIWYISNSSETNIDKILIIQNIFKGLNDTTTNKSIMVNNIPQPISNIILLFYNYVSPVYKAATTAISNISSYSISDKNIISVLNYNYNEFDNLEKIAQIQNHIKYNVVTQTPAPISLAPSSLAPSSPAPISLAPTSLAPSSLAPISLAPL